MVGFVNIVGTKTRYVIIILLTGGIVKVCPVPFPKKVNALKFS
jgi:hypothetical protein